MKSGCLRREEKSLLRHLFVCLAGFEKLISRKSAFCRLRLTFLRPHKSENRKSRFPTYFLGDFSVLLSRKMRNAGFRLTLSRKELQNDSNCGSSRFLWDEHIFVRQGKIADKREKIVIVAESITDSFGNFNLVIETFEFCGAYWM